MLYLHACIHSCGLHVKFFLCITEAVSINGCVCPGDTLTYECTVTGGAVIVWTGSAIHCPYTSDEIVLIHGRFNGSKLCNDGAIVARSLFAECNYFTSQLNVTITPDIAGKRVVCLHFNGTHDILIFSSIIPTTTG